jgi:hypothetical protein
MIKNADFEKLNFDEGFGYEGEIFFLKNVNKKLEEMVSNLSE